MRAEVAGLKEAGLLAEFNAANPGVAVQSGDIIVGVRSARRPHPLECSEIPHRVATPCRNI